jgi:glycosyltransferase involved in cell wall biosynthesis
MKKVLIITYYWPPAGGPGVQRWLKFVKYLPEYNIHPVVYIPENPTYPILDPALLKEIPQDCTLIKQKIKEPYRLASFFSKKNTKGISAGIIPNAKKQTGIQKLLLWIRGNLFIPDARVQWVKPSVRYLTKYISENKIETIITTGPPHSLHLIGLQLKKDLNIKWIADFRDPWTTIGYHKTLKLSGFAHQKHKALESKVLHTADTILVTSPTTQKEFQVLTTKPIEVITNGYDVENVSKVVLDEKFTLAHIGSFLSDRNPKILWESLQELIKEIEGFSTHFQLKLIGKVSQSIIDTLGEYQLSNYTNNLGYVSHQEAVEQQRKSQILLLIEIDTPETKSIIPGKLFEYMVSERPIIAIGPVDSDFESIIKATNTGIFCHYTEKEKLKKHLLACYHLYLENNLKVHAVGLQGYSRKNLTKKLAAII